MSTITLPNIRVSSDLTVGLKLKDGGVAIDWSTLSNIRVSIYADAQRSLAGRCTVAIDETDSTVLVCQYAANKPQYLGVNRVIVQCTYMGETKTYDKPAFTFVRWTDDQEGEEITISDPDVDVEIEVEDVSSSILNQAIAAALQAAEDAEHAAHLIPNQVLLDCEQATSDANAAAAAANAAGITSVQVSVQDNEPGTPSAECSLANKVLSVIFHYLKGETGDAAGFGTITASFVEDGGDPSVLVTTSGPDTAKNIAFTLKNFKGDKGDKGDQGNTGSSVDYPYELVNNCTTDDATKGLSAAQGKALKDELSQLDLKVDELVAKALAEYALSGDDLTSGKLITGNTVGSAISVSNVSGRYTTLNGVPVKEGDIIRLRYISSLTAYALVLTDSNDIVVKHYLGSQYSGKDVRLVIPSGVTKLYVTTNDTSVFYLYKNIRFFDVAEDELLTGFTRKIEPIIETGGINSSTGADSSSSSNRRFKISVPAGAKYISFQTSSYSSNYGYGFIAGGVWSGTQTVNKETLTIPVPSGATEFRTCYNATDYPNGIECSFIVFGGEQEPVDALLTDFPVKFNLAYYAIDSDGADVANTGYARALFDCGNMRTITFMGTIAGTPYSYAFYIGESWVVTRLGSAYNTAKEITVNVPSGATKCKVAWNLNLVTVADFWVTANGYVGGKEIEEQTKANNNNIPYQFVPDFNLSGIDLTTQVPDTFSDTDEDVIYSQYDALVTAYPNYVTKIDADTEFTTATGESLPAYMSGLHTYIYKFSPVRALNEGGTKDIGTRVRVMLTTIHSNEIMGLYSLARMMTHICENWKTDVNAEQCRSLIDFYVFPISCPWMFANRSRVNYNGVQINRNFPTRYWESSGSGTQSYSGTEAGSEYETKLMMYFANKYKPHFLMDCHTTNVNARGNLGLVLCVKENQQIVDLAGVVCRTIGNDAIKNNSNFPDNPEYSLYQVYDEPNNANSFGYFYLWAQQQGWGISILTEEAEQSNWNEGTLTGNPVEVRTPKIFGLQTRYLFNCVLRFVYAMCHKVYGLTDKLQW